MWPSVNPPLPPTVPDVVRFTYDRTPFLHAKLYSSTTCWSCSRKLSRFISAADSCDSCGSITQLAPVVATDGEPLKPVSGEAWWRTNTCCSDVRLLPAATWLSLWCCSSADDDHWKRVSAVVDCEWCAKTGAVTATDGCSVWWNDDDDDDDDGDLLTSREWLWLETSTGIITNSRHLATKSHTYTATIWKQCHGTAVTGETAV